MKNLAKNWKSIVVYVLISAILIGSVMFFSNKQNDADTKYSEIVQMFHNGEICSFTLDLSNGNLEYSTYDDPDVKQTYSIPSVAVSIFIDDIEDDIKGYNATHSNTPIVYDYKAGTSGTWLLSMIPSILMFALIAVIAFVIFRRMSSAMNNETNRTLSFGKIKARLLEQNDERKTTFEDVAGCEEEKAEVAELVDFLKEPEEFTKIGARIPKGVLLVGPPGTGKTLLARAIAGEADVPFLSISGSDFVEMYVGVGASRVRDLFEQAKKKAPAIVFIDEIDAVGRHRGAGTGNGNDEREQTLNQLLVELDGFGTNSGVIVIAATNRPDVLDPALLRPGRFDRQVTVNRPDAQGREDILRVHARNKPLGPDVDLKEIAKDTMTFTGSDLENLLNEAAILTVRHKKKAITMEEINEAISKVELGTEKKTHKYTEKAKRLTAYHEAGHAVASYYLENHDPVKEISIIPRGLGAGGYTWYTPQEENYESRNDMLEDLVSMLGGRVAEDLALGDISTGASNDLQRATKICRNMVSKFGMNDEIGPVVYSDDNDEVFLGKDFGHVNNYSERTSARIDEEIEKMMREAYAKTEKILKEHFDKLELVAEMLIQKEKLTGEQFVSLMETGELPPEPEVIEEEPLEDEPAEENEIVEDEESPEEEETEAEADSIPEDEEDDEEEE